MEEFFDEVENITRERSIPEALLTIPRETLYQKRDFMFQCCREMQEAVLKDILKHAQGSRYAKEHGFEGILDVQKWRETCPISGYADYEEYIERELSGEQHQLFQDDTKMVIATTGSTGKTKLFLESAAGNAAKLLVMAIRGMYMGDLLPVTRDMEAKNLTISNYAQLGETTGKLPIVRASGQTARNLRKKTGTMNILSVKFWEMQGISALEREYMVAVFALADRRLSKVFCNNLIAFGRILDAIENNEQKMIQDIREGSFSIDLNEVVREKIDSLLVANPHRAIELQKIYRKKGSLIKSPEDILCIWPNCQMVSCWLSGSVGRDAQDVLQRLPRKIQCFDMGYGASEGKINVPTKLACASGAAAVFSIFFEFIPLKGKEKKPICLWEVVDGEQYEILITTFSGLYRYRMLDIVRIDGFTGNTPNITFCGKSTEYICINGQEVYGFEFSDIVHKIEKTWGVMFELVQIYSKDEKISFILSSRNNVDYFKLKQELDMYLYEKWQINCNNIYIVKSLYKRHAFDERIRPDRGACGIKLPVIVYDIPDKEWIEQLIK